LDFATTVTVHICTLLTESYHWPCTNQPNLTVLTSVAELHHFYAAPGNIYDAGAAAPASDPAPTPTLLYSKAKFLKQAKV
jgi:hypothetical protein